MATRKATAPEEQPVPPPVVAPPNGLDAEEAVSATQTAQSDAEKLDEFERLARDTILEDEEEVQGKDEKSAIDVTDKMPKYTPFRANPDATFDLWGLQDESGLRKTVLAVTKEFAPTMEEEAELRRVRFYETVTEDG